jgi:type III pantothenate kinase
MIVLLTGGDAERMSEALPGECEVISDLVFEGLAIACPLGDS